jgi:putative ABC transport system substrate-binding protein
VVGYLYGGSPETAATFLPAFRKGLAETGYVEGQNVALEYRWANYDFGRLPELAADLVRRRVAVLTAQGGVPAALAAKAATTTIPVVFSMGGDPVQAGLVASLNRPGGNVTGVNTLNQELADKRLGLLRELLPKAARFALLVNPSDTPNAYIKDAQAAASALGWGVEILTATTSREIDSAFASLSQRSADALMVPPGSLFGDRRVQLSTLAVRHAVPAIFADRQYPEVGGLMSYGSSFIDTVRQTGIYVGRILKGEKPADMPVQQAVKVELVINLQTARTLGLDVPPTLLAIADDVIE